MTATAFIPAPWQSPTGVWSVLVDGPTEEPLTVAEAKLRAGLTWPDGDPRDAQMQDFIRAARAQVEHDTGLALLTQTRDVFLAAGCGTVPLPAQTQPTQAIEQLTPVALRLDPLPSRARLVFVAVPAEGATFRVVAGWPSRAALKAEAPALFHAVALLTAHYATMGRDLVGGAAGQSLELMPLGYEDAIAPHRLIWVP